MINKIYNYFLRPFPFHNSVKDNLIISFGISLFIFLFLIIFHPFDFDKTALHALAYGGISLFVLILNFIIFPRIFTFYYDPLKWNIIRMIILIIQLVLITSTTFWLIFDYSSFYQDENGYTLFYFIYTSFAIAFFPTIFYIYIIERIYYRKHLFIAENVMNIHQAKTVPISKSSTVTLGNNKNDLLKVDVTNILYISYEKNYVSVFYFDNSIIKEHLIRTTLSDIEKQLPNTSIVRCHRSYIVNTYHVEKIQGNARNYLLKISDIDLLIPVSRTYPTELLFSLVNKPK